MLEIVDAEVGGFVKGDGAEVAGHLEAARVCGLDHGREFGARDMHVGLERRRAFIGPEAHLARGVGGILQLANLNQPEARTFEIWRGRVDPRPGCGSALNRVLQRDVAVAVHVAAGAHRSHTAGEIQPGEAHREIAVHPGAGGIEQVLVHLDHAGDHRFSGEVHSERAGGDGDFAVVAEGGDGAVADDQGLVVARRSAGAVDDAGVGEGDNRCVDTHELMRSGGESWALRGRAGRGKEQGKNCRAHQAVSWGECKTSNRYLVIGRW